MGDLEIFIMSFINALILEGITIEDKITKEKEILETIQNSKQYFNKIALQKEKITWTTEINTGFEGTLVIVI